MFAFKISIFYYLRAEQQAFHCQLYHVLLFRWTNKPGIAFERLEMVTINSPAKMNIHTYTWSKTENRPSDMNRSLTHLSCPGYFEPKYPLLSLVTKNKVKFKDNKFVNFSHQSLVFGKRLTLFLTFKFRL